MGNDEYRSIKDKITDAYRDGGAPRVAVVAWRRTIDPFVRWRERTYIARRNPFITAKARIANQPVVHAIGDSHSIPLGGVYPFRVTWMGGATAFNLDKEGSTTGSREKLEEALTHVKPDRDVVLLILGEIDSRIHIFNQYEKRGRKQTFDELIEATVERYGAVVLRLKRDGYRVVIHSVPATPYQDNIFEVEHYADDEVRAQIVREFNRQLAEWSAAHGVEYLDMYSVVSDDRGFIRRELTSDGTHLNESALPLYQDWVRRDVLRGRS